MNPEGDAEQPDEGMPEDGDDEDDCRAVSDVFRARTEALGDE